MKTNPRFRALLGIALSLALLAGCKKTEETPTFCGGTLEGRWERLDAGLFPKTVGMIVEFKNGLGTVNYAPTGACFQDNDTKWKNYDTAKCQLEDLNRVISTCAQSGYGTYPVSFADGGNILNLGGIRYKRL